MATCANMCVVGVGEISNRDESNGRAVGKVETRSADPSWLSCFVRPFVYEEHGIALSLWYADLNAGEWKQCVYWDLSFRTNAASSYRNMGDVASRCGSTYYATWAADIARSGSNNPWIGDWVLSGDVNGVWYHLLP